jgi:general stress protein YciG
MPDEDKPKSETTPKPKKSAKADSPEGEMSVREAGKKGGDTVRNRYGSGFYEEIGRKGGEATRERHGAGFYEAIGQKGGKVVKEKYGADFYEQIGHKGGQKVKKLIADAKASAAEKAAAEEKKP